MFNMSIWYDRATRTLKLFQKLQTKQAIVLTYKLLLCSLSEVFPHEKDVNSYYFIFFFRLSRQLLFYFNSRAASSTG